MFNKECYLIPNKDVVRAINPGPGKSPAHIGTSARFLDVIRLIWS